MRQPAQKHTYYFRRNNETDQDLYRLLMRHPAAARTELFRDMVRSGFRHYLKRRRTKKRQPSGLFPMRGKAECGEVATVRWTIGARAGLREIVTSVALDSAVGAAVLAGRIVPAVERLQRCLSRGRIVPEIEDPTVRELIVGNYRVNRRSVAFQSCKIDLRNSSRNSPGVRIGNRA
jgi:toxin ParE1/3/4